MALPKHYSLYQEHGPSFEVHDKRDNKTFHIAKAQLDPSSHEQIRSLPKYNEGVSVPSDDPVGDAVATAGQSFPTPAQNGFDVLGNSLAETFSGAPMIPTGGGRFGQASAQAAPEPIPIIDQTSPLAVPSASPSPAPSAVSPAAGVPAIPGMPGDLLSKYGSAGRQEEAGLQAMGAAKGAQSAEEAAVYRDNNNLLRSALDIHDAKMKDLDAEHSKLANDIASGKIDPNHYWSSMSTGNKVLAAISMALGGIGSGLTHQPNVALGIIQKAISDDIDAQKVELGKKENLLSKNLQRYGDLNQATHATMMQLNAMAQGKIAEIGAKYGKDINNANTQYMLGGLKQKNIVDGNAFAQTYAQSQMKQKLLSGTGIHKDMDPSTLVNYVVPEKERQKVFDEIDNAKTISQNRDKILSAFDEAAKDNTILKTGYGVVREPGSVLKLKQLVLPLFKDIDGTVRQAAMDETFHNIVPKPGEWDSGKIAERRDALKGWLDSKSNGSTAKGNGIDLQKFSQTSSDPSLRFNPEQTHYYNWAKQNLDNPKAKMVLKKLGVQ